jgi:type II secretory pathway pseudopilin PulG
MIHATTKRRPGLVSLWAIIVLGIVGSLSALVAVQGLALRRINDQRQEQLQTLWLARSGLELAAQRLLTKPAGYEGETLELIPRSQVRIQVTPVKDRAGVYRVSCEAQYPTDRKQATRLTEERTYQRSGDKEQAQISVVRGE